MFDRDLYNEVWLKKKNDIIGDDDDCGFGDLKDDD